MSLVCLAPLLEVETSRVVLPEHRFLPPANNSDKMHFPILAGVFVGVGQKGEVAQSEWESGEYSPGPPQLTPKPQAPKPHTPTGRRPLNLNPRAGANGYPISPLTDCVTPVAPEDWLKTFTNTIDQVCHPGGNPGAN